MFKILAGCIEVQHAATELQSNSKETRYISTETPAGLDFLEVPQAHASCPAGSTHPSFITQWSARREIEKEWVIKKTALETRMSNWASIILDKAELEPDELLDIRSVSILSCIVSKKRKAFISSKRAELFAKSQSVTKLRRKPKGYLDKDAELLLTKIFDYTKRYYSYGLPQDVYDTFTRYINRQKAFEMIGTQLNYAITGKHAPKGKLLLDFVGDKYTEVSFLSKKLNSKDLYELLNIFFDDYSVSEYDFKTHAKDATSEKHQLYKKQLAEVFGSCGGFFFSLTIRLVLGDREMDMMHENMLATKEGIVNIDAGNFFTTKHNLKQALISRHTIIQYMRGGKYNIDKNSKNNSTYLFETSIEPLPYYLVTDEEAESEINKALEKIIMLDDDEIKELVNRFLNLPVRNEPFLDRRDAEYCIEFIKNRRSIAAKILEKRQSVNLGSDYLVKKCDHASSYKQDTAKEACVRQPL